MRKKYLPFIAIAIMMFFVACSNEDIITEENSRTEVEEVYTLSLTASMPGDEPSTRVALTPEGKDIKLTWQAGDRLQFAIVQSANSVNIKQKLTLTNDHISPNKKTVNFNLTLPHDTSGFVKEQPFDIYGLYGKEDDEPESGGLSDTIPTNVILTKNPGNQNNTLTRVQNRGDVMIYFESKDIDINNPPTKMVFNHLGSLFSIKLKINSTASFSKNFDKFRLVGVNNPDNKNWAYNSGEGGQFFDLTTGEFQNKESASNNISFSTTGLPSTLNPGDIITVWGWYPPLPDVKWPELQLQLIDTDGNTITNGVSVNNKPARTEPTPAGRTYHFYAVWGGTGTDLIFTDDTFTTSSPAIN